MELNKLNLLELLNNSQALYSTEYFGGYEVPADLLETIIECINFKSSIFNGVMFFQKKGDGKYLVVDGMKRLITLSLLLYAICECFKFTSEKNAIAIELIKQKYLFNGESTKIQLSGYEQTIYEKLITHQEMSYGEKQHPMFVALHAFWAKIKMNNISALKLFNSIKRVSTLACIYDKCKFHNREIYQSLNCNNQNVRGQLLLINNFLHETVDSEEVLNMWYEIIQMFKEADMVLKMRYFICDYLAIQKNGIMPRLNELYTSFKNYYLKMIRSGLNAATLFQAMKVSAGYYIKISTANFKDKFIKQAIDTIKNNNMYETFPYLLEVMDDYETGRISPKTFTDLLNNVILFIAEQRSGNIQSNINFASLSGEIAKRIQK